MERSRIHGSRFARPRSIERTKDRAIQRAAARVRRSHLDLVSMLSRHYRNQSMILQEITFELSELDHHRRCNITTRLAIASTNWAKIAIEDKPSSFASTSFTVAAKKLTEDRLELDNVTQRTLSGGQECSGAIPRTHVQSVQCVTCNSAKDDRDSWRESRDSERRSTTEICRVTSRRSRRCGRTMHSRARCARSVANHSHSRQGWDDLRFSLPASYDFLSVSFVSPFLLALS